MDNIVMGNAVLMPEFYGIGVKKGSKKKPSQEADKSNETIEVRKMNFKSTYDDYSEQSNLSQERSHSLLGKDQQYEAKLEEGYLKTQQSLESPEHNDKDTKPFVMKQSKIELIFRREEQKINEDSPFDSVVNDSIINSIMEIEDTELQKRASRQKCQMLIDVSEKEWRDGSFSSSLSHLEEMLKESAAEYPEDANQKAKVFSLLGSSCLCMSIYDRASDYYMKALSLLSLSPEENMKKIAGVHLSLATIYHRTNHIDEAIEHYEQSYSVKAKYLSKSSPELLMPLTTLAELECKQGNHIKAIQKYSQILAISRTAYGNSHIEVAKVFYLMALSLFQIREYPMWLEYHYECIRMMKELQLENHPDYVLWLRAFPEKLRELIGIQNYAKDVVQRSIHMAVLLLNQDEQIYFLEQIKGDLESSMIKEN